MIKNVIVVVSYRKRRGSKDEKDESGKPDESDIISETAETADKVELQAPTDFPTNENVAPGNAAPQTSFAHLLQPPPLFDFGDDCKDTGEMIQCLRARSLFPEEEQYKPHDKVDEMVCEEDEEELSCIPGNG